MPPIRRILLVRAFELFDLVALSVAAGVGLAAGGQELGDVPVTARELLDRTITVRSAVMAPSLLVGWHALLSAFKLYSSRRLSAFRAEARDVTLASAAATGVAAVAAWAFSVPGVGPACAAAFFTASVAILLASRVGLRLGLRWARLHGRNLRHVVVVGTNPTARRYAAFLRRRPELGYVVGGFVDEPGAAASLGPGDRVVCDFDHFPEYLRRQVVDEAVIFVPVKSFYTRIARIVAACETQGVVARVRSDLLDVFRGDLSFEEAPGIRLPLVSVHTGKMRGWQMAVKRLIDVVGAAALVVLASPVMAGAALAIRLGGGGPVFFVQERLGLGKRTFRLYKFRTMVPDAERLQAGLEPRNEVAGPVFKMRNDPRVTRVGRFLRRTSIDELPQLLNVLQGDMSLVGPRPLPLRDYQGFSEDAHRRRFSVLPGLTCLWQVSGRSGVPFDRWMELDMQYIDTWSLWLDLVILARTVPAVLKAGGT